ncbi:hypothetical protein PROFUN_13000 [Planoprotostelium fungivorum]|uniref:Biotin-protein ligase N-terminal domain-containing protein n=1 Tax=Planoprotostelium fungivorum TaxID=1890364 RepID=A0A2P6N616_9EUKA|nr:hypothetical protein PROFUN_13000 [Planoprotostelium fungivorum]
MRFGELFVLLMLSTGAIAKPPKAFVWRGKPGTDAAFEGLSEAAADLLRTSSVKYDVEIVGPYEKRDINRETLNVREVSLILFPGGGDLSPTWKQTKNYKRLIQEYVHSGGHYVGICLGAYLAGHDPGFELLPKGSDTDQYITSSKSSLKTEDDAVVQVDYFGKESMGEKRWLYFQDGAIIKMSPKALQEATVLARYSSNQFPAAVVFPYGHGRVGLIGPHPEANRSRGRGLDEPRRSKF